MGARVTLPFYYAVPVLPEVSGCIVWMIVLPFLICWWLIVACLWLFLAEVWLAVKIVQAAVLMVRLVVMGIRQMIQR